LNQGGTDYNRLQVNGSQITAKNFNQARGELPVKSEESGH
jgi:hypothetical protein